MRLFFLTLGAALAFATAASASDNDEIAS